MKILILLLVSTMVFKTYGQDKIITTDKEVIKCKILDTAGNEIKYKDSKDGFSYSSKYKYISTFTFNGKIYNNKKEFLKDDIDNNTGNLLSYTEVIKVDSSIHKDELFSRARAWFSSSFKDSKAVLDVQDKESGELIGKGTFRYISDRLAFTCYNGYIEFSIKVLVKDGRYKYEINNFYHKSEYVSQGAGCTFGMINGDSIYSGEKTTWGTSKKIDQKVWEDIKQKITAVVSVMVTNLKTQMSQAKDKNSEW